MADTPSYVIAESPNAPRPTGLALEIADMLRHIEYNYAREGSGPGSRFEGRLLEDVQAEAVLRRIAGLAVKVRATYQFFSAPGFISSHHSFADLLTGEASRG